MYVRKIICLLLSAVMICFCLGSCSSDKKTESSSIDETKPVIELPELPASVKGYGGTISVQSITLDDNYNESAKTLTASVSLKIEAIDDGSSITCKVNYKIVNENGVPVSTGMMGTGDTLGVGETYNGQIDIWGVQAGKKYKLAFFGS